MLGRVMWPTMLAPGNLPELARRYPIQYWIGQVRLFIAPKANNQVEIAVSIRSMSAYQCG
jgi:hypothetical protein